MLAAEAPMSKMSNSATGESVKTKLATLHGCVLNSVVRDEQKNSFLIYNILLRLIMIIHQKSKLIQSANVGNILILPWIWRYGALCGTR